MSLCQRRSLYGGVACHRTDVLFVAPRSLTSVRAAREALAPSTPVLAVESIWPVESIVKFLGPKS